MWQMGDGGLGRDGFTKDCTRLEPPIWGFTLRPVRGAQKFSARLGSCASHATKFEVSQCSEMTQRKPAQGSASAGEHKRFSANMPEPTGFPLSPPRSAIAGAPAVCVPITSAFEAIFQVWSPL